MLLMHIDFMVTKLEASHWLILFGWILEYTVLQCLLRCLLNSFCFTLFESKLKNLLSVVRQAPKARFPGNGYVPPAPSNTKLDSPGAGDGPFERVHVAHHVWKLSKSPCQLKHYNFLITHKAGILLCLPRLSLKVGLIPFLVCFLPTTLLFCYLYATTLVTCFELKNEKRCWVNLITIFFIQNMQF